MSTDSSSPRPSEETPEQENSNRVSFKDKFEHFVQENKTALIIISVVAGILLFISLIYFIFFYESKMERFADQFCACAISSESDFYNYSKDGFGYKSDLSTCFGMEFSAYGARYDKARKRLLLEDFKTFVVKKCPEKLDEVFEYQ